MTEPISKANATCEIGVRLRWLTICAALLVTTGMAVAQTAPHARKPHPSHKTQPVPETPPQAVPAPEPEQPKWPVNDAPSQPSVIWDAQGLHIQATNSSLSKILNDVSTQTGAKVEGLSGDERVFGEYGPGQARDVLAQLLQGSGYNFLLLGDQGQGTPREVILTRKHAGAVPNSGMNQGNVRSNPEPQPDEDQPMDVTEQPEPVEPPPQVIQPQVQPNQDNNGQMTPQQRMQMMQQQRMQQLQQMQQQQQQQQPPPQ